MKSKLFVVLGILLVFGFVLVGCDTGTGGGGSGSGVWSLLLGTWKSDDGNLVYEFEEDDGGAFKLVTVDGEEPYEQHIGFFFDVNTITANKISGDTAEFAFVLSDSNRTLTVSNFIYKKENGTHPIGPINFNGVLKKQP
jgi:hypothetical protein